MCIIGSTDRFVLAKEHRSAHSEWSSKNEIHAELNAILFAARNGSSIEGATMYVTLSPCPDCAKAIAQSGIKSWFIVKHTIKINLAGMIFCEMQVLKCLMFLRKT